MKLTRSEIETISIHMNAFKEKLCNQGRWNEAQEYQDIVDKLDELLTAEPIIRCKDCKLWMKNPYRESSVFGLCFKHKEIAIATDETDWCSWAERKDNG